MENSNNQTNDQDNQYLPYTYDRTWFECNIFFIPRHDADYVLQSNNINNLNSYCVNKLVNPVDIDLKRFNVNKFIERYGFEPTELEIFLRLNHQDAYQAAVDNPLILDDHFVYFVESNLILQQKDIEVLNVINKAFEYQSAIDMIDLTADTDDLKKSISGFNLHLPEKIYLVSTGYKPTSSAIYAIRKSALRNILLQEIYNHPQDLTDLCPLNKICAIDLYRNRVDNSLLNQQLQPFASMGKIGHHVYKETYELISQTYILNQLKDQFPKPKSGLTLKAKAYVISLKKTPERYQAFLHRNQDSDQIQLVEGIYGKDLSPEEKEQQFSIHKGREIFNRTMSDSEIGCTLSHIKIYRQIIEDPTIDDKDFVLILEDDALLRHNWVKRVNALVDKLINVESINLILLQNYRVLTYKRYPMIQKQNNSYSYYNIFAFEGHEVPIIEDMTVGPLFGFETKASFCYLVRKSAMYKALNEKPYWVADQFDCFVPTRSILYANPIVSTSMLDLPSLIESDRIQSFQELTANNFTNTPVERYHESKRQLISSLLTENLKLRIQKNELSNSD